ncbi:hypothetical protein [Nocardioides insulae]|nr:hypothetical protein [Nocardioides insulae]
MSRNSVLAAVVFLVLGGLTFALLVFAAVGRTPADEVEPTPPAGAGRVDQ